MPAKKKATKTPETEPVQDEVEFSTTKEPAPIAEAPEVAPEALAAMKDDPEEKPKDVRVVEYTDPVTQEHRVMSRENPGFDVNSLKVDDVRQYEGPQLIQCSECGWNGGTEELMDQEATIRTIARREQAAYFRSGTHREDLFCPRCRNKIVEHGDPHFNYDERHRRVEAHKAKMDAFVDRDTGTMTGVPRKMQRIHSEIDHTSPTGMRPVPQKKR